MYYHLQDWVKAKKQTKRRAVRLQILIGLKKHKTPKAKNLYKFIESYPQ
jgi:hypothetical protein